MDQLDLKKIHEDFFSNKNFYLIPPYIKSEDRKKVLSVWHELGLESHVFIFSSGTSGSNFYKTYALSKNSLLENAKAVNRFLGSSINDTWLCSLPVYHVGGLSILVRSIVAKNKMHMMDGRWNAKKFITQVNKGAVNFSSLVPTQLHDLIQENLMAPNSLRGVFVGGDFLASKLKDRALNLGWPIIETYGMTEACSQIASSYSKNIIDGHLKVLDIHKLSLDDNGNTYLESRSLYSHLINITKDSFLLESVENNKIILSDRLSLLQKGSDQFLRPLGRVGSEIKIKGRLIDFLLVQNIFEEVLLSLNLWGKASMMAIDDERFGKRIQILLLDKYSDKKSQLLIELKAKLPNLIDDGTVSLVKKLNKTTLGKFKV